MINNLHLVVTCTNKKSVDIPEQCKFFNSIGNSLNEKYNCFQKNLHSTNKIKAKDLYSSQYWSVVNSIVAQANTLQINLNVWICSAGHGLISWDSLISPYSITFSKDSEDSLGSNENAQNWWSILSNNSIAVQDKPITFTNLLQRYNKDKFLMSLSTAYLKATYYDIKVGLQHNPNVSIASVGGFKENMFDKQILPVDSRMIQHVGGVFSTLNINIIKFLFDCSDIHYFEHEKMVKMLDAILYDTPENIKHQRTTLDDTEIVSFIKSQSIKENVSKTSLLRQLRDKGYACEQKRFGKIYDQVRTKL